MFDFMEDHRPDRPLPHGHCTDLVPGFLGKAAQFWAAHFKDGSYSAADT